MSPLMKAQTWKKRSILAGNEIDMSGIIDISWYILIRDHKVSMEDCLRRSKGLQATLRK